MAIVGRIVKAGSATWIAIVWPSVKAAIATKNGHHIWKFFI
jgi:hypothetical protein